MKQRSDIGDCNHSVWKEHGEAMACFEITATSDHTNDLRECVFIKTAVENYSKLESLLVPLI